MSNKVKESDFGMKTLRTKALADHVGKTIKFGGNIAIFGRRGTGKTFISKQQIEQSNCKEIYLNCSTFERVDLGGYPDFSKSASKDPKKFIDFLLPGFYQYLIEGKTPCVALLDEVDKADPSVWAPLLEFTQFHTMNGRLLPNLQAVIMTGNLTAEGGQRPCLPLLDRAEKYIVESDVHGWLEWAGKSREIHPSVAAYISDHPEDLFGTVDPGDVYADPSPRGWHNASKILNFGESDHWDSETLSTKVSGCVGKKAGIGYQAYFNHYQVLLPLIDKVFAGEKFQKDVDKLEPSKKIVAAMIISARFSRKVDECKQGDHPAAMAKIVAEFLNHIDSEMALVALRSQVTLERLIDHGLDEHPSWAKLLSKISTRMD